MRIIRSVSRSKFTIILLFIIISMTFVGFQLHRKDKNQEQRTAIFGPAVDDEISPLAPISLTIDRVADKGIQC